MSFSKNVRRVLIVAMLLIMVIAATPVLGAPDAVVTNLLQNPSFEGATYWQGDDSSLVVSEGWAFWWEQNPQDCYNGRPVVGLTTDSAFVSDGVKAARYYGSGFSYNAGLFQTVDVTQGKTYRFTVDGMGWSTDTPDIPGSTSNIAMAIGIDPKGGSTPFVTDVVWSAPAAPMDAYAQFTVEVTAESDKITVFVRSRPDWCVTWNDTYWDNASLVEIDPSQPTEAPTTVAPTAAPTATPSGPYEMSTPDANGRLVHLVQVGDTLSQIAWQYRVSTDQIKELNNMTNNTVMLGTWLLIKEGGEATPEPTEEPTEEATPELTEEPTQEPIPEPTEEPTPETTTQGGSLCVMSWDDSNGNGIREAGEERLAGISFMVSNGSQLLDRYTTDGISEPHCFSDLLPGTYTVSWVGDSFAPTTDQTWSVSLNEGSILTQEFGARSKDAEDAESSDDGGAGMPSWLVAVLVGLGIFIVLIGGGLALYFFVLRRNKDIS